MSSNREYDFEGGLDRPLLSEEAHDGNGTNHPGASVKDTCFIILSIYVGLGLLSQPYGLKLGGWLGLVALLGTAALFFTSASLLGKACDLLPPGLPRTFPVLGDALAGPTGRAIVSVLAGLELFGAVCIAIVVVIQQLELLLPSEGLFSLTPLALACIITGSGFIPVLALPDVSRLAPIAAAGSGASLAVALAVLSLIPVDPTRQHLRQQPPAPRFIAHWPGIIQSIGIFAVSMSGHSTLPALRAAMRRPDHFHKAVGLAFFIMATLYALVAAAGYWYWGEAVSPLAVFDLATNSPYSSSSSHAASWASSWWGQWVQIDRILASLVLITCSAKVPALVLVIHELLKSLFPAVLAPESVENELHLESSDALAHQSWRYKHRNFIWRLIIGGAALALGVAARNELGNVLSLVGGACSMATSLILPVAFYSKLSWQTHGPAVKFSLSAVMVLGVVLLTQVTWQDARQMWHQKHG